MASIQLSNIFATIVEKAQVASAIYSNQVRLAELILTDGQQISSIDQEQGQVQAQADEAIAQIQATTAQEEAGNAFWTGVVSAGTNFGTAAYNYFIRGTTDSVFHSITNGIGDLQSAFSASAKGDQQSSETLRMGQVQANAARQIADLNAQIAQINATEQAQAEYVQADTTMLNLSADLASLQGQAGAQGLQIQLKAQQVDQERSKLANMISQVSYLLGQWVRSATLVAQNPEFTGDLLITRDAAIEHADDAFGLAQQWAFLAALCFNYKDNCPQDTTSSSFVQQVLAARNAASLSSILTKMVSDEKLIGAGCQGSIFFNTVQFSVRNNFFQANATQGAGTNTVVTSYEPVLQGGLVLTNAAASLAAWSNYLASNVITNQFGQQVLVLNFNTSLDAQLVGGLQWNPLWTCDSFGTTLYSGSDNNGNQLHGVQVSLSTQGFSLPLGSNEGFVVNLAQAGASVIRNRGFGNKTISGPGFRYFNFGFYSTKFPAAANNIDGSAGTAAFEDRSPANGQWELTINANDSANNGALLNNLGQLTDIQLQFGIRSYIDQTAAQACGQ